MPASDCALRDQRLGFGLSPTAGEQQRCSAQCSRVNAKTARALGDRNCLVFQQQSRLVEIERLVPVATPCVRLVSEFGASAWRH